MKFAVFAKHGKPTVDEAISYLKKKADVIVYQGNRGDKFPVVTETPDVLISYLSPWIIPAGLLAKTRRWNINFHPGPPEYPGIGCFNFAIYNNEKKYGVTAHLMEAKVDSGKIIGIKRFSLIPEDDVFSLSEKSYTAMLNLFYEVMDNILNKGKIATCKEGWKRKPYTRKELNELCRINTEMDEQEIRRRVRATKYPGMPGAYVELGGYKFEYHD